MTESGERWAALRNTMQFADLLRREVSGPGPACYLTTGVYDSFELVARSQGRRATSSFLLCSLSSDALGLPQSVYLDFPRSSEWEVAVGRYRALSAAFGTRSQNVLLRLTNRRLSYMGPHVQEYLAGLDTDWEERLTRWTRAVQNALAEGTALPPSPREAGPSSRRMEPALDRDPMMREQMKKEGAVPGITESHQNARSRDTTTTEHPGTP